MSAANKGESRIRWMLAALKVRIDAHMPTVSQINVAVFGFSRGAAQARAFIRIFGEHCERRGNDLIWTKSGGSPSYPKLEIYFLGVFDTVASVGFGGSRAEKRLRKNLMRFLPGIGFMLYLIDDGGHS